MRQTPQATRPARGGAPAPRGPAPRTEREAVLVVPLTVPIRDGGEEIREVRFTRWPNFGDLEAADDCKGNMGKVVILVSRLANLTVREVREIAARDMEAVSNAVSELLGGDESGGPFPATGES